MKPWTQLKMKSKISIHRLLTLLPTVATLFFCASAVHSFAQTNETKPIRVACIGDSITAGAGISNPADHYPERLGKLLGDKWEVKNFGQGGACVRKKGERPYLNLPTLKKPLAFMPDVVIFMLGVNDLSSINQETILEFETDYKDLIVPFKALPSKHGSSSAIRHRMAERPPKKWSGKSSGNWRRKWTAGSSTFMLRCATNLSFSPITAIRTRLAQR